MSQVFFYEPHPDDFLLSMGLAGLHYIANGFKTTVVNMTKGNALGLANTLNGQTTTGTPITCTAPVDHPYIHDPAREGYAPLTTDDVGAARLAEARSTLGAMAMVPQITDANGVPIARGDVSQIIGGLDDGFGDPSTGSSTATPTRAAIDAAKAIMLPIIQANPNSFHYTMSPADHHKDHAACGIALREIKQENPTLLGAPRFFISRLYWTVTDNLYAEDLRVAAGGLPGGPGVGTNGTIAWFTAYGSHYSDYVAHLRNKVIGRYRAWNPAGGAYSMGYHSVAAQFESNFGPSASVANLWHA